MNYERINELENFVEEFNKKLEEAQKTYEKKLEKEQMKLDLESQSKKQKEKKKEFTENLFKEPEPWRPNNPNTREFDKFKKLDQKTLSDLEKSRIHMIKRSYTKLEELPKGKDFKYTKSNGSDFGEVKNFNTLSELGKNIITKFINDNEEKIKTLREKEEEIFKYNHSKHPVEFNPWKFNNHSLQELSTIPADKVHSFKTMPKPKYLIHEPFKIPKIYGDYFEKRINL